MREQMRNTLRPKCNDSEEVRQDEKKSGERNSQVPDKTLPTLEICNTGKQEECRRKHEQRVESHLLRVIHAKRRNRCQQSTGEGTSLAPELFPNAVKHSN